MNPGAKRLLIVITPCLIMAVGGCLFYIEARNQDADDLGKLIVPARVEEHEEAIAMRGGNQPEQESVDEPVDDEPSKTLPIERQEFEKRPGSQDVDYELVIVNQEPVSKRAAKEGDVDYELRSEKRRFSSGINDLFSGNGTEHPKSLGFPLFEGRSLKLTHLRHQSMAADRGVVMAKAASVSDGGHILLSYVGDALAGAIHLPSRNEFYEIRTAPDGVSHILSRIDPSMMPPCQGCAEH